MNATHDLIPITELNKRPARLPMVDYDIMEIDKEIAPTQKQNMKPNKKQKLKQERSNYANNRRLRTK